MVRTEYGRREPFGLGEERERKGEGEGGTGSTESTGSTGSTGKGNGDGGVVLEDQHAS